MLNTAVSISSTNCCAAPSASACQPCSAIRPRLACSSRNRLYVPAPNTRNDATSSTNVSQARRNTTRSSQSAIASDRRAREPGPARQALGLEGADLVGVAQRQADVVPAVDEALL